ncbi:hypothetical protein ACEN8K_31280 [Variovorax sp. CT11-76]
MLRNAPAAASAPNSQGYAGDALAHQLVPGPAIAVRQQLPDQRDAEAAVARRARRRLRELERGERHHQVGARGPGEGIGVGPRRARRQRGQVRQTGRVGDELAQRDRGHGRRQRGLVGEQPAQRVVEREVAALHRLCEQQAGEDLADRSDLEHRLRFAGRHRPGRAGVPGRVAQDGEAHHPVGGLAEQRRTRFLRNAHAVHAAARQATKALRMWRLTVTSEVRNCAAIAA